jgi:N4-gp56 family major capsid protein
MPTSIPVGSPLAVKAFSAALFAQSQRKPTMRKNLTGPAPKQTDAEGKLRGQTSPDFPIVQVRDLIKNAGDTVTTDLVNIVTGKPIMGDKKITGKLMSLSFASQEVKINQWRGGVDGGGRMTQKRTKHNLRNVGMANLAGWAARLEDQICQVALAGARGSQNTKDWVVPLEGDADFAEIMVNAPQTPSFGRYFVAGGGDKPSDIGSTDILTLDDIDRMKAVIDDMDFPLQPIRLPGDVAADDEPMYLLTVTPRQWHFLQNRTGEKAWRTFLQNAWNRSSSFKEKHPLFMGEPGMWNGILVRKASRSIRFDAGDIVKYYSDATTEVTSGGNATAGVVQERAVLLGAQALIDAYGVDSDSGYHYSYFERMVAEDHNNSVEMSVSGIGGKAKVRFNIDGAPVDHGVMVIDSYAPDPRTTNVA